jgi:nucleoside phosphorylase
MRVLVTFAVEAEFAPWKKLRSLKKTTVEGLDFFQAQIGRAAVDFVVTGMGEENAAQGVKIGMREPHSICIGAGFAGALRDNLNVGDVLAARAVQKLGKAKTLMCGRNLQMAARENKAIDAKMFLTAERVIETSEEKKQLSPFGEAVDMESFGMLSAAVEKKVSAVAIRVISDRFDQNMPEHVDRTIDERGRVVLWRALRHLAAHPLQVRAFVRLGFQSKTAAESLANFLEAYIKHLSFREPGWPPSELSEMAAS